MGTHAANSATNRMPNEDYDQLEILLASAEHSADPAEVHGTLCGMCCALGDMAKAVFVAETLGSEASEGGVELFDRLNAMADQTLTSLDGAELDFALLLPPDRSPAVDRLAAIASWCGGFLHGLGGGLSMRDAQPRLSQEPLAEIVGDLVAINQADLNDAEEGEAAEQALLELSEYLRVVTQLCYESLADLRKTAVQAPENLH